MLENHYISIELSPISLYYKFRKFLCALFSYTNDVSLYFTSFFTPSHFNFTHNSTWKTWTYQEVSMFLWEPKVYYRIQKNPQINL